MNETRRRHIRYGVVDENNIRQSKMSLANGEERETNQKSGHGS